MMRILGLGGALALTVVAIAGCGGGDDDGDSTATTPVATTEAPAALSREELIAQGDAICAEVNAAVGTVGSTSTGSAGQAGQVADLYSGMADRLADLGAPSDDSAGYAEFIEAAEQLGQAQSDAALAAERGEEEVLASVEAEASTALSSFQSAASTFGFQQCSEGPSAPPVSAGGEAAAPEEEESSAGVEEEEVAPEEVEEEVAPEAGGAAPVEEESAGGGAAAGGGTGSSGESSGGGSSGGVGPG
jgi:hypothetical protein